MLDYKILRFCFILFSVISLQAQNLQPGTPKEVGMSSERLENLSRTLDSYVTQGKLPGTVCLVARKGKIIYYRASGYKDLEGKIQMEQEDLFRIASQSKAIVSTGIMILQERGLLTLFDPVSKFIPEFKNTSVAIPNDEGGFEVVPAKREISIRDLLTHTSGFDYGYGYAAKLWKDAKIQDWYFAYRDEPILETVKRMAVLPATSQPGEKFIYGYNTDILGAIVEVVSKQPLDTFLKENIFIPLGMHDTFFYVPKDQEGRLTTVYQYTDGLSRVANWEGTLHQDHYLHGPRKSFSGGAGLVSTAYDYALFLQTMLNKGIYNGNRILSRKSIELMTTVHIDDATYNWAKGVGFGLGFSVVENLGLRGILGSEGEFAWGGAYHSTYWVDPKEELLVVYMTQVAPIQGVDDHEKLRALIYQAIID